MSYSLEEFRAIIIESYELLKKEQGFVLNRSHNVNERTVTGHLRDILARKITSYDIDCEYNRMIGENDRYVSKKLILEPRIATINTSKSVLVYPDIIIHKRKTPKNVLVIEVKLSWKREGRDKDIQKLKAYTRQLGYTYGLYLELDEEGITEMIWFQEGQEINAK